MLDLVLTAFCACDGRSQYDTCLSDWGVGAPCGAHVSTFVYLPTLSLPFSPAGRCAARGTAGAPPPAPRRVPVRVASLGTGRLCLPGIWGFGFWLLGRISQQPNRCGFGVLVWHGPWHGLLRFSPRGTHVYAYAVRYTCRSAQAMTQQSDPGHAMTVRTPTGRNVWHNQEPRWADTTARTEVGTRRLAGALRARFSSSAPAACFRPSSP